MLENMPVHVLKVVQAYRVKWEAEAEKRGHACGYAEAEREILGGMRVLQHLRPDLAVTVNPVDTPKPLVVRDVDDLDDDEDAAITAELSAIPSDLELALDGLFGDDRWSDLDRQELVRLVMAAVQESLTARGRDPTPVLEILARMGGGHKDDGGFDAAMAGGQQLSHWLSWNAVPLKNPRGDHRFMAENGETGNKLYGEKALGAVRRQNRDAKAEFEFGEGQPAQPYDLSGKATVEDHTTAYRQARKHIDEVRERLMNGGPVRPGDLADYTAYLGLMRSADLRDLRAHLVKGLTRRIKSGRRKGDRVANIRDALDRLKAAAVAISTAVLKQAEEGGIDISPVEAEQVNEELGQDVLLAGEFGPDDFADAGAETPEGMAGEVQMADMATTNAAATGPKPMPTLAATDTPMPSAPMKPDTSVGM